MKINPSLVNNYSYTKKTENVKENQGKNNETKIEKESQYISGQKLEKKITYDKPKVNQAEIQRLKEESDRIHENLRRMVEELLKRQGMTFNDLALGKEVIVDETARNEAQALIGEGGELSPEKVSDRIVDFAKAISGGDREKFEILKSAIEEGFKQAAEALGGVLPEICQKTYDLVMEKLNHWAEEETAE
ncbi:MAG: hypothetical protein GXW85_04695 [Clostridia bacterium]|nr:hypothetical protein [Clostridia bacterium]